MCSVDLLALDLYVPQPIHPLLHCFLDKCTHTQNTHNIQPFPPSFSTTFSISWGFLFLTLKTGLYLSLLALHVPVCISERQEVSLNIFQTNRKPSSGQTVKFDFKFVVLGWPKGLYDFFHKIKDTFSIFTNNFFDLDILNMLAISHYWLLLGRDQGCC